MSKLSYSSRMNNNVVDNNVYCKQTKKFLGVISKFVIVGEKKTISYKNKDNKLQQRNLDDVIIDYSGAVNYNNKPYKWCILEPVLISNKIDYDNNAYNLSYSVDCLLDLYTDATHMLYDMTNRIDPVIVDEVWLQELWNDSHMVISSPRNNMCETIFISKKDIDEEKYRSIFDKYDIKLENEIKPKEGSVQMYHNDGKTIISFKIPITSAKWFTMLSDLTTEHNLHANIKG